MTAYVVTAIVVGLAALSTLFISFVLRFGFEATMVRAGLDWALSGGGNIWLYPGIIGLSWLLLWLRNDAPRSSFSRAQNILRKLALPFLILDVFACVSLIFIETKYSWPPLPITMDVFCFTVFLLPALAIFAALIVFEVSPCSVKSGEPTEN